MKLAELIQMWFKNKWGIDSNIESQCGGIDSGDVIAFCGRYSYIKLIVYDEDRGHGRVVVINDNKWRDEWWTAIHRVNNYFHHEDPQFFSNVERHLGLKL